MDKIKELFRTVLVYYGSNDYAGHFFVREVCNNLAVLKSKIALLNGDIRTLDDAYLFLLCLSLEEMVKEIGKYNLKDDEKNGILSLSASITINDSSFVNFINEQYIQVFDKTNHKELNWPEFFPAVIELCYGRYCKGIKEEVFRFLERDFALELLNDYGKCSKYYSKHREEFKTLFNGLKTTRPFDDQIYLRFLVNRSNHKDSFLKEQATFICERSIKALQTLNVTSDDERIFQAQYIVQDYGRLAILYRLPIANSFTSMKKDVENTLNDYIKKHGQRWESGPISLEPARKILKESKNPYKFIQLTHLKKENGQIDCMLNSVFSETNKLNPLSEEFEDISRKRSDRYPYYKQDYMETFLGLQTGILNMVICDEDLKREFANFTYNLCLQVQERYFNSIVDIEKEVSGVVDSLDTIIDLYKNNHFESRVCKALVYGTSLSICTTIEKVLRNTAFKETCSDIYVDVDKIALAAFFKNPFKLKDVSDGLKYYLEFYLIKQIDSTGTEMDRPGLNLRNKLMHGQDEIYERTNYGTCLILFYFLLALLDDLFLLLDN